MKNMQAKLTNRLFRKNSNFQRFFRRLRHPAWLGTLRRTTPLSYNWGRDRGTPVDRYYITQFLEAHRGDIHGKCLEIGDSRYMNLYGVNITQRDILDIDPENSNATIIADLTAAEVIPTETYDCFILNQTLQYIFDIDAAVHHAHRILRSSGVLLAVVPSVSRINPKYGVEGEYWRFTEASCKKLFGKFFGAANIQVRPYGNLLTCMAFLAGMAKEDLHEHELEYNDPNYPLILTVRAFKDIN
jgi:hypothetical protein